MSIASQLSFSTATSLRGGNLGSVPYQQATSSTAFLAAGTAGTILTGNGSAAPTFNNTLTLAGTTASTSTITGALQVVGGAGIGGNLYVGGITNSQGVQTTNIVASGTLGVTGTSILAGVQATNISASGTLGVTGTSLLTGVVTINNATSATSTNSGALQVVNGGVGIGGNLFVGGSTSSFIGNVAIGTTIPRAVLHVQAGAVSTPLGGANTKFFFVSSGSGSSNQLEIQSPPLSTSDILFSSSSTGFYGMIRYDNSINALSFHTANNQVLTINSSGAVGIGYLPNYGTSGQVLQSNGTASTPSWVSPTTLSAATATNASNLSVIASTSTNNFYATFVDSNNATAQYEAFYSTSSIIVNPGNGQLAIGTTPTSAAALTISRTYTTATAAESFPLYIIGNYNVADTNLKQTIRANYSGGHTSGTQAAAMTILALNSIGGVGGTTTNAYNYWSRMDNSTGATVTNAFNFYADDGAGSGGPGNQYGLYVANLSKGTVNYAVYTAGSTPSRFGGPVTVVGALDANGGAITTNQTTFNLVNATATTVNFAGAATSLNMGASGSGTTNVRNNLTVSGNLTVQGVTTIVDSTVTNIADPILTLGGGASGAAPTADDNKDRGIAFKWVNNGGTTSTGFFGYQDSTGFFTYITTGTFTNEVVTGTRGAIDANLAGGAGGSIPYQSAANVSTFLAAGTSGYILQTNGAGNAPTWIPVSGLSAGTGTQVNTVLQQSNAVYYPTFVSANNASASAMSVYTSGTFVINPATGYHGIGTASPGRPLHVVAIGTATQGIAAFEAQASGLVIQDNSGQNGNVEVVGYKQSSSTYHNVLLRADTGGLLVQKTTGNVIIGSTATFGSNASTTLSVVGQSTNRSTLEMGTAANTITGVVAQHYFYNGVYPIALFQATADGTNTGSGIVKWFTQPSGGSLTERFRIDPNGSVGVGTNYAATGGSLFAVNGGSYLNGATTITNTLVVNSALTAIGKATVYVPSTNIVTFADNTSTAGLVIAGTGDRVRLQLGVGSNTLGPYGGWIQASYDNTGGNIGNEPLLLNPSGGNVGIGTTSTSYTLDVNGAINNNNDIITSGGRLSLYRSAGASYIDWASSQALAFRTETSAGGAGATELMRITSAGGISFGASGTAYGSAGQILQSNGNASPTWVNTSSSIVGVSGNVATAATVTNATFYPTFVSANNTSPTGMGVYTTGSFVINPATGFHGINTSTAQAALHVQSGGVQGVPRGSTNTKFFFTMAGTSVGSNYFEFQSPSTADSSILFSQPNDPGSRYGIIRYDNSTGAMSFWTTGTQQVTILQSGNVGIGTASPNRKLHVQSSGAAIQLFDASSNAGAGIFFAGASTNKNWFIGNQYNVSDALEFTPSAATGTATPGTAPAMVILSGGNVGIGTTNPPNKLTISNNGAVGLEIQPTGTYTGLSGVDLLAYNRNSSAYAPIGFITNSGNNSLVILTSGNVGIATTTPRGPLDVVKTGYNATGNWYEISRFVDGSTNKGLSLGYDSSAQLGMIVGHSSSAASGLSFWSYNGSGWGERMRLETISQTAPNLLVGQTSYSNSGVSGTSAVATPALVIGGQTTDSMYFRRWASGQYQTQTYLGGNAGYLQLQPYGGNVMIGGNNNTSTNKFEVQGTSGQLFSISDSFTGTIFSANDVSGVPSIEVLDTGLVKMAQYSGQVVIGTGTVASSSATLSVYGMLYTTGTLGEIRASSEITAYYSSDRRLKENIKLIEDPITMIDQISGVYFDWTDEHIARRGGEDGYFVRKHDIGVIAQEIEAILPEVVAQRADGFLAVKYEKIVPLLIEAIKAQQADITLLKSEIANLKNNLQIK